MVEIGTITHYMGTVQLIMLYKNELPQLTLIQTKYTYIQKKETSKSDIINMRHCSTTAKRRSTSTFQNIYGNQMHLDVLTLSSRKT